MKERLDKYVSDQILHSRRDSKKAIKDKRVTVNGAVCTDPGQSIDPEADVIALDDVAANNYKEHVYYMLNKPSGVVSATTDRTERTVIDLVPPELFRKGLFPAGRLDKNTTGLLIITDDGEFSHRMLSPNKHVVKKYIAELDTEPDEEVSRRFEEGIVLPDGYACKSGRAELLGDRRVAVYISEGKFHQVKRMFSAIGYRVEKLRRVQIGALELDPGLAEGEVRELTDDEIRMIFE